MRTQAAILTELNAPLTVDDVVIPELQFGQVLVRIKATGICGKQLDEYWGTREDPYLPHLLGHEASGIVEEVGMGVSRVKPGDHIVACWLKGTGINAPIPQYQWNGKKVNAGNITTFQFKSIISENRLTPISKKVPFDVAALFGCAIPTGFGTIFHQARVVPGSSVVVFGAGGVGLCAIMASSLVSASKIIAVDIKNEKLRLAKELGATHTLNAKETDLLPAIKDLTGEHGADYAISTSGDPVAMEQAYLCTKKDTGYVVLAAVPGKKISFDAYLMNYGKRLVGSHGGGTDVDRDIPRYLSLYQEGKLKVDRLITDRFKLGQINEAMTKLSTGQIAGRALLEMD